MKIGQIIDIIGDKRKKKYQIRWRNGDVSLEIATSLWVSTEPEESDSSDSEDDCPGLLDDSDDDMSVTDDISFDESDLDEYLENPEHSEIW